MTTHAALQPVPVEVVPGSESVCRLTLRNDSDIVQGYDLDVVGDAQAWSRIEPATVRLFPGDDTVVDVVFAPTRVPVVPVGEVPFAVRVVPSERPDDAVAAEGVVLVLPYADTSAEIIPRTSRGRAGAKHEVAVDNRGNVPITVSFAGVDVERRVTVRTRPPKLTVGAGQAAFATVVVRNRRRLWRGQPVNHPFQVVVTADDGSQVTLDAATLQTPVVPRGAGRLLAAAASLLALALLAWFFLLKPAVGSAAKEAVRKPVAQAQQDAADANRKADEAQKSVGKATPSVAPSAPPAPGTVVAPARVRLQTDVTGGGTSTSSPFTAPAKTTLVLTDLVLQNPQGDTGRVDVLVDNQPILTLALANFRDLDFHFVSPIEVPTGKTVKIRTTCQVPGPALAGTTGSRCRTWALVTGSSRTVG